MGTLLRMPFFEAQAVAIYVPRRVTSMEGLGSHQLVMWADIEFPALAEKLERFIGRTCPLFIRRDELESDETKESIRKYLVALIKEYQKHTGEDPPLLVELLGEQLDEVDWVWDCTVRMPPKIEKSEARR